MFVLKRNQVIITALVIMIAVAGYLNYSDTSKNSKNDNGIVVDDGGRVNALVSEDEYTAVNSTSTFEGEIGEAYTSDENPAIAVNSTDPFATLPSANDPNTEPGEAVFVSTSVNLPFFVQAKLEREQARAKQTDLLLEVVNNTNIDQTKRAEAADAMLEIQKRIEKETAAEAMIEAKGFKEVYVRIDDNTVDVVVNKEALSDAEIAQIEDIVKRKTGVEASNIRISPMKKQ